MSRNNPLCSPAGLIVFSIVLLGGVFLLGRTMQKDMDHRAAQKPTSAQADESDDTSDSKSMVVQAESQPSPDKVMATAGNRWEEPKNVFENTDIDWTFNGLDIAFYKSDGINIFGKCPEAEKAVSGKFRVRGKIQHVSTITKQITISDATIEPVEEAAREH